MNHAVISIGSNTADNKAQIAEAIKWLEGTLLKRESITRLFHPTVEQQRE